MKSIIYLIIIFLLQFEGTWSVLTRIVEPYPLFTFPAQEHAGLRSRHYIISCITFRSKGYGGTFLHRPIDKWNSSTHVFSFI